VRQAAQAYRCQRLMQQTNAERWFVLLQKSEQSDLAQTSRHLEISWAK